MLAAALCAALLLGGASPPALAWQALEPGLDLGLFDGPAGAPGDGKIAVVRIDPRRYRVVLLGASMPGEGALRTAREWAARHGAAAAINAAMYQADYRTSVSLMRTRDHVNQPRVSKDRAVLALDPLEAALPPARIVDLDCEELRTVAPRYGTLIQSIRMVSCARKNVWAPSARRTSAAAIGIDGKGRLLFIHARSAWPVHDLVDALLALPLDLRQAMYVEGGPEAQLYVRGGGREVERVGAFESSPAAAASDGWPIPNVVAAIPRGPPPRTSPPPRLRPRTRPRGG
ncbi:phosphodiester glycosidase family protein [Anaeromyxobacter oryzisoli]|uniref:phosphodiester glycosidase family protein n=1 Tax=Anaeromyxobacter oryzisoli TaxID=2925408 RepID=UPI001F5660E8|nr:phosphodiester glycosidase family protein [Anaeromyxobacter sp. SG63]